MAASTRFPEIRLGGAGPQAYTLDAHISTRTGTSSEVIAVTLGQMVVYTSQRSGRVYRRADAPESSGGGGPRQCRRMMSS